MKLPIFQLDAFADRVFSGNPAAVCLLDEWLDDATLQDIAIENNLSETAFLLEVDEAWELRWFTPVAEVKLCGHATLAGAWVIFELLRASTPAVVFHTRWAGELTVTRRDDLLEMDLPARPPRPAVAPEGLEAALGIAPTEVWDSEEDLLVVLASEAEVRSLQPDFAALGRLDVRGVIVTARGATHDFVSRFFAPRVGVPEDPVTGSAHCVLVPYWAGELGRAELRAQQVSRRGGELLCGLDGDRVTVAGRVVLYLEGTIDIRPLDR